MALSQQDGIATNSRPLPSSFEHLNHQIDGNRSISAREACIYRTSPRLSQHNRQAYEPTDHSIGPFHYGQDQLRFNQEHKRLYFDNLLSQSPDREELQGKLIDAVRSVLGDARRCYAEPFEQDDEVLINNILVIDGCFIIEVFRRFSDNAYRPIQDDPIFSRGGSIRIHLTHDLILLENQIPWLMLDKLFNALTLPPGQRPLIELALEFFAKCFPSEKPSTEPHQFNANEINHIFDLFWKSLLSSLIRGDGDNNSSSHTHRNSGWQSLSCFKKMCKAGIKFKLSGDARSIFDVKFNDGVVVMPSLSIYDSTEIILRNFISYEQNHSRCSPIVTSYAGLLYEFVDDETDIDMLVSNGIISTLWDSKDVKELFRGLLKDVSMRTFYYDDNLQQVNLYRKRWWPRFRYFYLDNFSTPWAIVSQAYGLAILTLTFLQTLKKDK